MRRQMKDRKNTDKKDKAEKENEKEKEEEPFSWKREILSWIQVLVIAALAAFLLDTFVIANSRVPSGSMENTIMAKDRVIGSRLHYSFGKPQRGDIAIFVWGYTCRGCGTEYQKTDAGRCPSCGRADRRNSTIYYVKRVIGMPGDVVDIHDGHVYLNGSDAPSEEPYLAEPMQTPVPLHYEVPEEHYLMLGDNRNFSSDSRFWKEPYIDEDQMVAKVLFRYFPKIGILK